MLLSMVSLARDTWMEGRAGAGTVFSSSPFSHSLPVVQLIFGFSWRSQRKPNKMSEVTSATSISVSRVWLPMRKGMWVYVSSYVAFPLAYSRRFLGPVAHVMSKSFSIKRILSEVFY